jgi:hypothetical protein
VITKNNNSHRRIRKKDELRTEGMRTSAIVLMGISDCIPEQSDDVSFKGAVISKPIATGDTEAAQINDLCVPP